MILRFSFEINGDIHFFDALIRKIAAQLSVHVCCRQIKKEYSVFAEADMHHLEAFSSSLAQSLPISLFFVFRAVECVNRIDMIDEIQDYIPRMGDYDANEARTLQENLFYQPLLGVGIEQVTLECHKKDFKATDMARADEIFNDFATRLLHRETCVIRAAQKEYALRVVTKEAMQEIHSDGFFLFYTDQDIAATCALAPEEFTVLSTCERPFVRTRVSSLSETRAIVRLVMPGIEAAILERVRRIDESCIALFVATASGAQYDALLSQYPEHIFPCVYITPVKENRFIRCTYTQKPLSVSELAHGVMTQYANEIDSFFSLYASIDNGIRFFMMDGKKSTPFPVSFETNMNIISHILQENGDISPQLLSFLPPMAKEGEQREIPCESSDFLDVISLASQILGFSGVSRKERVLSLIMHAETFLPSRGPSIDFVIQNGRLDTTRFVRSLLSYKTAGADSAMLAFGVIESMTACINRVIEEAISHYTIRDICVYGSLFESKVCADKLLLAIPSSLRIMLPTTQPLDVLHTNNSELPSALSV